MRVQRTMARKRTSPVEQGGRRRRRRRTATLVAMLVCLGGAVASAQEVRVQTGRGPHYVGEPIEIQVVASDFEEDPTPEIEAAQTTAGRLRYAGVSDSSSTSISIINGRMSRVTEVNFVYRFEFVANEAGRAVIPAFTVRQGNTTRTSRAFELEIQGVPKTGLVDLDVVLPDGPIFVGQRVPVEIVFSIDREAQRDLLSYQTVVPLFELPTLRFLDEAPPGSDTQLEVETAAGTLRLPAVTSEVEVSGRNVLVVKARRTMIALSPEEIRASPARVVINRGTRFRRDLFNQRQATASMRMMAEDDPIRLEVIEVPRVGRPPSFAGAVGKGFSLEVSADRSVVQLGEPILLSFHLRGDGDLSTASLPPLDAEGLFDPSEFRLPEDPPAGLVDETGKHFEASVRVLDAEVREVPAIAYSWFDAESRAFETTYSAPIALSVGAAEIIGADAVTRRPGADPAKTPSAAGDSEPPPREQKGPRATSFAFSGANLAVDEDPTRVLGGPARSRITEFATPALYVIGAGLLVLAAVDRRRRSVDPRLLERAQLLSEASRAIEAAARQPSDGSAALGRALRSLVAALPEEADADYDGLIADCDALRFGPDGGQAALPPELVARARRFVEARRAAEPGHEMREESP